MTHSQYEGSSEMGSCYDIGKILEIYVFFEISIHFFLGENLEQDGKGMKSDISFDEIALDVPPPANSLCSSSSTPNPKTESDQTQVWALSS